ncbi:hypothetical protein N1937_21220 [Rhizobium sp. WSM4643]|uniref:hypothetical protein n=1 Tax=Rhizobium TaxID=379 RepID=UPI001C973999|nr:hypothetical protein [Rhizobium leguminosarum]MBY5401254.1 hypothetical protein [Rhizobium leguminosarum]UWM75172.1 hypothetical protein N1937_21220 [Rhizobium leguminosarum bv. viciae]
MAVLKSLDVSPRRHRPKRDEFRNPEVGEFRDPEVGFFLYGDAASAVGSNRPASSDGKNRVGRRLTDYGTFHLDAGLEDQDCNLFWLIGSFVNLLSRQKDASSDRIPHVQFIAAQTPSSDTDLHAACRCRRSGRSASIAAHNVLIAPNIN